MGPDVKFSFPSIFRGFLFHPNLERIRVFNPFFSGVLTNLLGQLHATELGTAH